MAEPKIFDKFKYGNDTFIVQDNVSGYITTETDPTVPAWAKADTKPTYTASEVGAVPTTRKVNGKALSADVNLYFADVKTSSSDSTTLATALDNKVDKVSGKGLSTNDYTTADQTKLAGIAAGAEVNVQANWNESNSASDAYIKNKPTIPTKTSDLTNDGDGTSAYARMSDIGSLGGGTITKVKTTAGAHTVIDVSSGDAKFNVPTKTSHLTNDSGYITSADLPEGPLIGDTDEISPAEVLAALQAGRDVYITYPHATYGNIVVTSFNSSAGFGVIASNMIGLYNDEFSKTHYMLFEVLGQLTGGWTCYTTFLASESDIPSVPTIALSSTTGITASTTATKTTLGTAGSVIGVQSSTTTASKVTLSGSNSFSASVSNHVLSFSHGAQTVSASDVTVPIKDTGATSIPNVSVESATVTITDPGHTHQLGN